VQNADGGHCRGTPTGTRGDFRLCSVGFAAGACGHKTEVGGASPCTTQTAERKEKMTVSGYERGALVFSIFCISLHRRRSRIELDFICLFSFHQMMHSDPSTVLDFGFETCIIERFHVSCGLPSRIVLQILNFMRHHFGGNLYRCATRPLVDLYYMHHRIFSIL
jgi:hypothetical protein